MSSDGIEEIEESSDEAEHAPMSSDGGFEVYELVAAVAHIHDPACQNLVAHIKARSFPLEVNASLRSGLVTIPSDEGTY